ncbi:hypothetical protein [Candidatus Trichorickettsia mobilis]|uniref:hypothetical protein n=1 Tax=Candidatus Trichorickettsia mobilis TaxID=1346319 RepID=UPI002930979B|nr:hypothetical protein [Candidatus Trichorickettsia mobilis]
MKQLIKQYSELDITEESSKHLICLLQRNNALEEETHQHILLKVGNSIPLEEFKEIRLIKKNNTLVPGIIDLNTQNVQSLLVMFEICEPTVYEPKAMEPGTSYHLANCNVVAEYNQQCAVLGHNPIDTEHYEV